MSARLAVALFAVVASAFAQETAPGLKQRQEAPNSGEVYSVPSGTHILLNMINSVSTKQAQIGDRIYLETAFPVIADSRIAIPQGSWVTGTVTAVKRPGHGKGRGELTVQFDSLTLPNGVSRNFHSDLGAVDARSGETLNREKSKVDGPSDTGSRAGTVAATTATGAGIGAGIGDATRHVGRGIGIGAGVGAAAGVLATMMARRPDATLTKGSTVEMVLDRPISFSQSDLNFSGAPPRSALSEGTDPAPQKKSGWTRRLPY